MAFENISKRRLVFAPRTIVIRDGEAELRILAHKTNYAQTERIIAPSRKIHVLAEDGDDEFIKLPELVLVEGNLSVAEALTLILAKLQKIDGDLYVLKGARFYAPILEEVTGFIHIEEGAIVNAPMIETMLSNDDSSRIEQQSDNWLDTM